MRNDASSQIPLSDNLRKYKSRNPLKRILLSRFIKQLLDVYSEKRGKELLEVGCGEGMLLKEFAQRWPSLKLSGLDVSPDAIRAAERIAPEASLLEGSAFDLPFESDSFDTVLCVEVLEHLSDPARAMQEIARVASQRIILSVPHEPWFRLGNLAVLSHPLTLGNPPDHCNHWRVGSFLSWASEWMDIERVETPFPWIISSGKPKSLGAN